MSIARFRFHRFYFLLLSIVWLMASGCVHGAQNSRQIGTPARPFQTGAEQVERWRTMIGTKRVGLIVNPSSRVGKQHLIDVMQANNIDVRTLFAVEHGIRGNKDAGAQINNGMDSITGLPVVSLYGEHKAPNDRDLKNLDVLVFDLQDVGVRFYTYLSSLHYVIKACAKTNTPLIVLDRPNPNGAYIDGPVLEPEFRSFVGMHEIPLLHGMTLGELALMINQEEFTPGEQNCELSVIPLKNYSHDMPYVLPVKPSPNLPNEQSVGLYPSLALFEATDISVGRGTPYPFQVLGGIDKGFGTFSFTPRSTPGAALSPKHMNKTLYGEDLRHASIRGLQIEIFMAWAKKANALGVPFLTRPQWLDKLMGTDKFRLQLEAGYSAQAIRKSWQKDLEAFKRRRAHYLLYPDKKEESRPPQARP